MPPLTIAILWLLCLSHCDMVDGCRNHLLLDQPTEATTDDDNLKDSAFLRHGIIRCMSGITESISLPGLLLWLPHMLTITPSTALPPVASSVPVLGSPPLTEIRICLHQCGPCIGESLSSLMFTLIGSAINFISNLSLGSDDSHLTTTTPARETMRVSLRNLSLTPLVMIQSLCLDLKYFSLALSHERIRHSKPSPPPLPHLTSSSPSSASHSSDVLVYGKVFTVWLELEISSSDFENTLSGMLKSLCSNGYYHRDCLSNSSSSTDLSRIKDFLSGAFTFLLQANEVVRQRNLKSTASSPSASSALSHLLASACLNLTLLWWCGLNSLASNLLEQIQTPSLTNFISEQRERTVHQLHELLSVDLLLTPMMTLFLSLKEASLSLSCQLFRSPDSLPPNSSVIDSSSCSHLDGGSGTINNIILISEESDDVLSVWMSLLIDVILKVIFLMTEQDYPSSSTPLPASLVPPPIPVPAPQGVLNGEQFIYCLLTHLSSLNIEAFLTNTTLSSTKEERAQRILRFCSHLSHLTLINKLLLTPSPSSSHTGATPGKLSLNNIQSVTQQFINEWNRKRKHGKYWCQESAVSLEKLRLIGEEIFPFPHLLQTLRMSHSERPLLTSLHTIVPPTRAINRNLCQELMDEKSSVDSSPISLITPSKALPSRSFAPRASLLSCSPYSPVIPLRKGGAGRGGGGGPQSSPSATLKATPPHSQQHSKLVFDHQMVDLRTTVCGQKKRSYGDTSDTSLIRLIDQTGVCPSPPLSPSSKRARPDEIEDAKCTPPPSLVHIPLEGTAKEVGACDVDSVSSSPREEEDEEEEEESEVIEVSANQLFAHESSDDVVGGEEEEEDKRGKEGSSPLYQREGTLMTTQFIGDGHPTPTSSLILSRTLTSGFDLSRMDPTNGELEETQTLSGRTFQRHDQGTAGEDQGDGTVAITRGGGNTELSSIDQQRKHPSHHVTTLFESVTTYLDHAQDAINSVTHSLPLSNPSSGGHPSRGFLLQDGSTTSHPDLPQTLTKPEEQIWISQLDTTLLKCHELMGHLLTLRRSFPSSSDHS
jgi:hypothetical protein